MPRQSKEPAYRLHKHSGQARVRIDGHDHYLGVFNSEASFTRYQELLAQWRAKQDSPLPSTPSHNITVSELMARYLRFSQYYYRHADGTDTGEFDRLKAAMPELRQLFGATPASEFGPLRFKDVRETMIHRENTGPCKRDASRPTLSRTYVNAQCQRIIRMFRWAAEEELIPASVPAALREVRPLKRGRCEAYETRRVEPVPDDIVETTLPFMPRPVQGMVRLQRVTGMRAGEIVQLRACDIDFRPRLDFSHDGNVWLYSPQHHKNEHRDNAFRTIPLGPRAQEILQEFLIGDPNKHVFDPREAVADRPAPRGKRRRENQPPNKRKTARTISDCYNTNSYRSAIHRACDNAFPPPDDYRDVPAWRREHRWGTHQLRHAAGTEARHSLGLESAQAMLGQKDPQTTVRYAADMLKKSVEAAARIG
jgi:integrase